MSIRQDLHTKEGIATYANGMNLSVNDKAKILEYIKPGKILEVGCGNGTVLEMISNAFPESHLVGIDLSAQLLGLAAERQYAGQVDLFRQDALTMRQNQAIPQQYDTIVFCSVLHEIFSWYLLNPRKDYIFHAETDPEYAAYQSTMDFIFDIVKAHLKVGGHCVIRDGIKPVEEPVTINRFKAEGLQDKFYKFADDFSPFKINFGVSVNAQGTTFTIPSTHLFEFLTKYFYDKNWDIEVTEQFGWATIDKLSHDFATREPSTPLSVIAAKHYTLDFLRDKWDNDLEMRNGAGDVYYPCSTMVFATARNEQ